jgi:hypothetical protein
MPKTSDRYLHINRDFIINTQHIVHAKRTDAGVIFHFAGHAPLTVKNEAMDEEGSTAVFALFYTPLD